MYEFSLNTFLRLFEKVFDFEGSSSKDGTDLRVKLLIGALEKLIFSHVSRSLFKADRLIFAMYLIHELHESLFESKEWSWFLKQTVSNNTEEPLQTVDIPIWIPTDKKQVFSSLLSAIPGLATNANFSDIDSWSSWIKSNSCDSDFPPGTNKKLRSVYY